MKASRRRITQMRIAELAGVSFQVVSAILSPNQEPRRGTLRFSEETRERVLRIAAEQGYLRNRTASSLYTGRHRQFGILFSNLHMIPHNVASFLAREAARRDNLLVLEQWDGSSCELPIVLREDALDGLLLFESQPPRIERRIVEIGLPVLSVNARPSTTRIPRVLFDEGNGVRMALEHFKSLGCSRVLLAIGKDMSDYYNAERLEAARRHSAALGMREPAVWTLRGGETAEAALASAPDADCAIAQDFNAASKLLQTRLLPQDRMIFFGAPSTMEPLRCGCLFVKPDMLAQFIAKTLLGAEPVPFETRAAYSLFLHGRPFDFSAPLAFSITPEPPPEDIGGGGGEEGEAAPPPAPPPCATARRKRPKTSPRPADASRRRGTASKPKKR